jgi:hypothetical protein
MKKWVVLVGGGMGACELAVLPVVVVLLLLVPAEAGAAADEEDVGREEDDDAKDLDEGDVSLLLAARRRDRNVRELCCMVLPALGLGMTVLLR